MRIVLIAVFSLITFASAAKADPCPAFEDAMTKIEKALIAAGR